MEVTKKWNHYCSYTWSCSLDAFRPTLLKGFGMDWIFMLENALNAVNTANYMILVKGAVMVKAVMFTAPAGR